jgi:6-phospho-3-hexuloisomerase
MSEFGETASRILGEIGECLKRVSPEKVDCALDEIARAPRIFAAGAGRSGVAIRGFANRLMHLGHPVHVVGEISTPSITAKDLLIIGSGSGRTESLVAMAGKAKKVGARILLLTIDPQSPIGTLADLVIEIPAPSPKATDAARAIKSIQPLGSLFEQSLFVLFDTLVVLLMRKGNIGFESMFQRHANLE